LIRIVITTREERAKKSRNGGYCSCPLVPASAETAQYAGSGRRSMFYCD
jgi:hypothetical protein